MPYITVRGVSQEKLIRMQSSIANIVAETSNASVAHIKVFYSPLVEIKNGAVVETAPSLDVYWMPRPQEVCDNLVAKMCEYFKSEGLPELECTFTEFEGRLFYANGKNYA